MCYKILKRIDCKINLFDRNSFLLNCSIAYYFAALGLCIGFWVARLPEIKEIHNLSNLLLGTVLVCAVFGAILCVPFVTLLNGYVGSRNSTLMAATFLFCCFPLIGLPNNGLSILMPATVLLGFGMSFIDVSMNGQASLSETLFKKSLMGMFYGVYSIGSFIGVLIGGALASSNISILLSYIILGCFCIPFSFVSYYFLVPKSQEIAIHQNNVNISIDNTKPINDSNKLVLYLCIIGFLGNLAEGCFTDWSTVFFTEELQASPFLCTVGFATFACFLGLGRFCSDIVVQSFGSGKVLFVSGLTTSIGIALVILSPFTNVKIGIAVLGLALSGVGVSPVIPVVTSTSGKIPGRTPADVLGFTIPFSYIAFLVGPPLVGWLSDIIGKLHWAFLVICCFQIFISIIILHVPRDTVLWKRSDIADEVIQIETLNVTPC